MSIMLNTVLAEAGFAPAAVRLLRHKDTRAKRGRTPYELWRDDRSQFERYQSIQGCHSRTKLSAPYWASFVVNLNNESMFVGVYAANYLGAYQPSALKPPAGDADETGDNDAYNLTLQNSLSELVGRMFIDWGPAPLAWVQHADRKNKLITEIRAAFEEPSFPGFLSLIRPLSTLRNIPTGWIAALQSARGVYLLTCPRTREQYVGSATGASGFWGRWQAYLATGHGGNVELKSRDPSDYQLCILEVAGSSATTDDILAMEGRWQRKLQSREMGLNRNAAG